MLLSGMAQLALSAMKMALARRLGGAPGCRRACRLARCRQFNDAAMPHSPFFSPRMSLERATVRRIARLARLVIGEDELDSAAAGLSRVLDLADQLAAADTAGIEPMAHPHEQALAWRADAVTERDRADALLALAPETRGGYYLVPKVIE
jgi:aspartyl-tRNA(Asn)/glutamyl-tRNA(Gln) amidotransferase subunit C